MRKCDALAKHKEFGKDFLNYQFTNIFANIYLHICEYLFTMLFIEKVLKMRENM